MLIRKERFAVMRVALLLACFCLTACSDSLANNQSAQRTPVLQVRVIESYPHDPGAFTQGLAIDGEHLLEGTGQYGGSSLRRVDLESGKVLQSVPLHRQYFGEGVTVLADRIYQLTWKERTCIVYNKDSLQPLGVLNYSNQGWGLADDGKELYLSDGTSTIRVLDPNFKLLRRIRVKDGRRGVSKINELEYVNGFLLANVWYEDRIAKIDPQSGQIVAWIDCSGIYPASSRPSREHVLNGIAYDEATEKLYVTGKNWPRLYQIEILDEDEVQ